MSSLRDEAKMAAKMMRASLEISKVKAAGVGEEMFTVLFIYLDLLILLIKIMWNHLLFLRNYLKIANKGNMNAFRHFYDKLSKSLA